MNLLLTKMAGSVSIHFHALRMGVPHGFDRRTADWKRARASRLLFHDLVHEVLLPLDQKQPIDRVEL